MPSVLIISDFDLLRAPSILFLPVVMYFSVYVKMLCFQLIHSCLECLGAIVNNVTHNYSLIKDCFQKFLSMSSVLLF